MRVTVTLILGVGAAAPAHAYLDPGLAYSVLQPLLVAIAGASAAIVSYKDRLRGWFEVKDGIATEDGKPDIGEAVEPEPARQSPGSSEIP